jgi:ketosteroid isomerase-like protein
MKIVFSWCVLGFMALGHVSGARAEVSSGDTEKAIAALEQQWAQAERENKADLIAPLLAEKFMITESPGQVLDRVAFLAEERSEQYSSSDISDLNVKVFGDAAIARYVLSQKYTNKGKAFDSHVRETDTWVKGPNGTWQCVASHSSTLKKT